MTNAKRNQIPFKYMLSDVWYSAADNMMFIKHDLEKDFIMPLKANRMVTLSEQAKHDEQWVHVDQLTLEANICLEIYLESVDFPLLLLKRVFANEDGSTDIQYLVSSHMTLSTDQMPAIYRKRWNVEPYHKPLKQVLPWKSRLLKRSFPSPTICLHLYALVSSWNGCVKPPNSIILRLNPNCT